MVAKQIEIVSQSDVWAVAFVDESQVVGGYEHGDIRRWKIEDGQQQGPTIKLGDDFRSLAVSNDGRWIVSGDHGKKAIVWDADTHEKAHESTGYDGSVTGIDISSDCTKVVAGSYGTAGTARIFGITSGAELLPPFSHCRVRGVKFSPDGSRFATVSNDSGFRVYSTHDGNVLFDSGRQGSSNASVLVTPLAWSSDGQQLFAASKGKITCFDVSDSSCSEWSIHDTGSDVSIASNGRFIACSAGKSVSLWDCVSHKQVGTIITHTASINCIALSPSGGYLACAIDETITVYNLRDVLPSKYIVDALPLIQVSSKILKSWIQDNPMNTEMLLSEEITSTSSPSHHLLAHRALIRVRLKYGVPAIEDVKDSLRVQPSPIGYIAMAVALLGQGDRDGALCQFDLAFHDCESHDNRLLLLLRSILVFESGNQEDAITRVRHLATRAEDDNNVDTTYVYTQVLAAMYLNKGNYNCAIPLIERAKSLAPKDKQCPPLTTISLIFGWSFNGPDIVAQQHLCQILYADGRMTKTVEILNIIRTLYEEVRGSKATAEWIAEFTQKCATRLERAGDEAFGSEKHDDAITQYSTALSLSPPSPVGLLFKRSRARAAKELWEDALQDAIEAVKADPSNPWGYKAKHMALHGAKRYDEAVAAFNSMLHAMEQSPDPATKELRKDYVSPSETIATIDLVIHGILKHCPLVVIDVSTGRLCDGPERMRIFKADPSFKELVSSMTSGVDQEQIHRAGTRFFGYVMFSHVWQGNEPSFQDVISVKSVWNLPNTILSEKLQNFCKETRRLGYRWAWSDTCCIDKTTGPILNQSLTSMYKWYADSAATLVFIAGIMHPSNTGDLARSLWMTRAWTLQELLAPGVILFYDSEWKPYVGNTGTNHKESPEIMQELADAIRIPRGTIVSFSPGDLGVHEKLRLASTRNATVEEDVAYSLIGIFKSDIRPHYGEGADALGHLLEEIVTRFGEVTVLAWSGKPSSYHSCLPASISVYNQTPYDPPPLEGEDMKTCITELRGKMFKWEALAIYKQIKSLRPARFAARRLYLPCIIFPVRGFSIRGNHRGDEKLYHAKVSGLGDVEVTTTDDLTLDKQKRFVLAHPWIRHVRGPSSGVTGENDSGSDTDTDSGLDGSTGLDEDTSSHAVAAPLVGSYARALEMIARLGQPFNALLLVQQPGGEYKRVAADNDIFVPGLGTDIDPKDIRARVLEIL